MLKNVTVGIIAKNEAFHIRDAVRNAKSFCKNVIVVDTGSDDGTARIAREAGAEVHSWKWQDDFAAARNHMIGLMRTDWALMMDADQRFVRASDDCPVSLPTGGSALADIEDSIARTIAHPGVIAGQVWHHDAVKLSATIRETMCGPSSARIGDPYFCVLLIKRALAGPWYQNAVHEDVAKWVERHSNPDARLAVLSRGHVVHYGQIPEVRAERGKILRNRELLKVRLAKNPQDHEAISYLIHEYLGSDLPEEAAKLDEESWPLMQEKAIDIHMQRYGAARMYLAYMRNDFREVIKTSRILDRICGKHPDFAGMRAAAYEAMQKPTLARESALECIALIDGSIIKQSFVTHPVICDRILKGTASGKKTGGVLCLSESA